MVAFLFGLAGLERCEDLLGEQRWFTVSDDVDVGHRLEERTAPFGQRGEFLAIHRAAMIAGALPAQDFVDLSVNPHDVSTMRNGFANDWVLDDRCSGGHDNGLPAGERTEENASFDPMQRRHAQALGNRCTRRAEQASDVVVGVDVVG
jgi:hypothetical protein